MNIGRLGIRGLNVATCALQSWNEDNVSTTGAALAYYCAFSLAPLLVIILAVAGLIVGRESAYSNLNVQLVALFGATTAKTLLAAAQSAEHFEGVLSTIVSIVTLLIGATTVLSALQTALDQIWKSGKLVQGGVWGWIRARFLSLGFILALGFLLLVSLTVSTAIAGVQRHIVKGHGILIALIGGIDFLVSISIVALLFAVIFRFMPARRLGWRAALTGGMLTAALFELGRWLIGLYLAHSTQASAFGAAASFVALLVWLYYTAQIFLFGAEFTACLGGLREESTAVQPSKDGAHESSVETLSDAASSLRQKG
jgi:membrane protein